ncbi:MAG: glycosyltransferase, partial [Desulfopila sp.]|nr:glycosyltransferase [Desulfopila sp.]
MNICMFTNTYLPHVGGVARSVHFFAEDLRKMGNKVLIIAPTFSAENVAKANEHDVLRVPAIQNFNGSDFSVRIPIPFFIDEKIDEFKPDIIHSHHPFLLGDAAIRAAYRRNLPLVFTHHTLYEQYTHYVSADSEIMAQLAINLSTEYANLCTRVVAPSESIASLISERGVTVAVEVIPTGVDVAHFQNGDGEKFRQAHKIPKDAVVLGHLGRLAPEKNLEYLSHAAIQAISKKPENLYFLVVGSGPSASEIEERFGRAGLQNKLIMAGEKSGNDLADAYNAMNLFLFSSQSETQGMVLVEAMSASLPVIALDAPGAREVVSDRKNGRLLPADTSAENFAHS